MKNALIFLVAFVLILVAPVAVRQSRPPETRVLNGPTLAELTFREVELVNAEDGLTLAALLFPPRASGPRPAVVVIHGSGDSRRENRWYLSLAAYLQDIGIWVLLPDKRGSERSEGDWRTASFEDLSRDTEAAIDWLLARHGTGISSVGVVGMSQGGQVAPIVAATDDDVDFVINVVGSALPFHDALVYEETMNLEAMGVLPGLSDFLARASSAYIRRFGQPTFWTAIGNHDPLPYWAAVDVPVLVLYGEADPNTPSRASAANLRALGKDNIDVVLFEGSGHALEDPPGRGDAYFRADALERIGTFISRSDDAATATR